MIAQMSLFKDDKQIYKQRKLLEEIIDLIAKEIYEREFNNVYGTMEKLRAKREKTNKKVDGFIQKVRIAFLCFIVASSYDEKLFLFPGTPAMELPKIAIFTIRVITCNTTCKPLRLVNISFITTTPFPTFFAGVSHWTSA